MYMFTKITSFETGIIYKQKQYHDSAMQIEQFKRLVK